MKIRLMVGCSLALGGVLLLNSCGNGSASAGNAGEYTLNQLDSLGKAYKPSVGRYGGQLRLPLGADPDGFCPATSQSAYSNDILTYIFEGLVTSDPVTLEHKPHIATSWTVSEDGLVWTFSMRTDVNFADGKPLTAHDVVFTFNDVIYNPKNNSSLNYNFRIKGEVIKVSAVDDYTVRFELPEPFAPFLTVAGMSIMPEHLYGDAARKGTIDQFMGTGVAPARVVGSGPFMLDKVELGQRVVLKRNPNYWKKDAAGNRLPYLDNVTMVVIKEPNVQMMKFKGGEIDHISLQGEHYPMLKPLEQQNNFRLYRVGPSWYESFFVFNQNNQKNDKGEWFLEPKKQQWFRSKEFRQACAYAINYEEIINIVYNGLASAPAGIWGAHKGHFHNDQARRYQFNPDSARALLEQAGFHDRNGDGIREDSAGNAVEFTLTTSAGVQAIQDMYELVRKDLRSVGLNVHLNFVEFNNLIDKTSNTFDFDAAAYALGGIIDPHFGKSSVTSTSFRYTINPQRTDPKSDAPIAKQDRDWELRINEIFELGVSEMDAAKRKLLYDEWQAITMEQCTHVYMPLKEVVLGASNRFGNMQLTRFLALGQNIFHNVDELYVKE